MEVLNRKPRSINFLPAKYFNQRKILFGWKITYRINCKWGQNIVYLPASYKSIKRRLHKRIYRILFVAKQNAVERKRIHHFIWQNNVGNKYRSRWATVFKYRAVQRLYEDLGLKQMAAIHVSSFRVKANHHFRTCQKPSYSQSFGGWDEIHIALPSAMRPYFLSKDYGFMFGKCRQGIHNIAIVHFMKLCLMRYKNRECHTKRSETI